MRLVLAQMKHETNTFSPVPTPLARFAHGRPRPPEGRTAIDGLDFPTRPFYTGTPWFLAPSILWYRLRDRINR